MEQRMPGMSGFFNRSGSDQPMAAAAKAAKAAKKKRKGRKGQVKNTDEMGILAKLLGGKRRKIRRGSKGSGERGLASVSSSDPHIGRGLHPVFKPLNGFFNSIKLDEHGLIIPD